MTRLTTRSTTRTTQTLARTAAAGFDFDVVTDAPPRRPPAASAWKDSTSDPKPAATTPTSEAE